MITRKKGTRKRVNNPNIDTALNDIYNKLERLLPATMQELLATTHEPDEGTVIVVDENETPESSGGGSSIAFYKGGQWNIDINSKCVPANKTGFKALLGSKGASGTIIPGESVFYNNDGNIPIKSFDRNEILLNVTKDKLSIRKSDNSNDADIAGANVTFSGDNFKLGTGDIGILLKNNKGVLQLRNVEDDSNASLTVNQIRCSHVMGDSGNKTVEVGEAGGTVKNHLKITNAVSGGGPSITAAGEETNVPITITSKGTGNATFKAVTGDVEINAGGGDITFKRSLTTLGSFDTSGNFTATGTSASSNGTCLGKYQYETIVCGFTSLAAGNFLPLVGGVENQTGTLGKNEYIGMVAPYTGTIEKILFRSEVAQNGTLEMDIHESADGTEVPAASAVATKDTSINIADDTTQDISFASMTSGTNVITKGRIYAIKITSPSAPQDTNVTVVFKWDVTT